MSAPRLAVDGGSPVRAELLSIARGSGAIGAAERAAVLAVLDSRSLFRYYGPDPQHTVDTFEAGICAAFGAKHAVAVSSGTAALRTGLAALGVGCGDEVVVPAFTFIASVNAVVSAGAVPVFAEVDDSLNIDPRDLADRITGRTAAVMPVHLENVAADMDPVLKLAKAVGVAVLEDAAQAIGATYRGKYLGTIGDLGAFSLQAEKNVTAGEGGVVVTDDDRLAGRAARFQDQGTALVTQKGPGRGGDVDDPFVGENLRMTELSGAVAGVQLRRLPGILDAMRANHWAIAKAIGSIDGLVPRRLPDPDGIGGSSLTWFLPDADTAGRFVGALLAEGIPATRPYDGRPVYSAASILARRTASGKGGPWNCAEHPTSVRYRLGMCPKTEDLVRRAIMVGVGPAFTAADCDDVAEAVTKVAAHLLGG